MLNPVVHVGGSARGRSIGWEEGYGRAPMRRVAARSRRPRQRYPTRRPAPSSPGEADRVLTVARSVLPERCEVGINLVDHHEDHRAGGEPDTSRWIGRRRHRRGARDAGDRLDDAGELAVPEARPRDMPRPRGGNPPRRPRGSSAARSPARAPRPRRAMPRAGRDPPPPNATPTASPSGTLCRVIAARAGRSPATRCAGPGLRRAACRDGDAAAACPRSRGTRSRRETHRRRHPRLAVGLLALIAIAGASSTVARREHHARGETVDAGVEPALIDPRRQQRERRPQRGYAQVNRVARRAWPIGESPSRAHGAALASGIGYSRPHADARALAHRQPGNHQQRRKRIRPPPPRPRHWPADRSAA